MNKGIAFWGFGLCLLLITFPLATNIYYNSAFMAGPSKTEPKKPAVGSNKKRGNKWQGKSSVPNPWGALPKVPEQKIMPKNGHIDQIKNNLLTIRDEYALKLGDSLRTYQEETCMDEDSMDYDFVSSEDTYDPNCEVVSPEIKRDSPFYKNLNQAILHLFPVSNVFGIQREGDPGPGWSSIHWMEREVARFSSSYTLVQGVMNTLSSFHTNALIHAYQKDKWVSDTTDFRKKKIFITDLVNTVTQEAVDLLHSHFGEIDQVIKWDNENQKRGSSFPYLSQSAKDPYAELSMLVTNLESRVIAAEDADQISAELDRIEPEISEVARFGSLKEMNVSIPRVIANQGKLNVLREELKGLDKLAVANPEGYLAKVQEILKKTEELQIEGTGGMLFNQLDYMIKIVDKYPGWFNWDRKKDLRLFYKYRRELGSLLDDLALNELEKGTPTDRADHLGGLKAVVLDFQKNKDENSGAYQDAMWQVDRSVKKAEDVAMHKAILGFIFEEIATFILTGGAGWLIKGGKYLVTGGRLVKSAGKGSRLSKLRQLGLGHLGESVIETGISNAVAGRPVFEGLSENLLIDASLMKGGSLLKRVWDPAKGGFGNAISRSERLNQVANKLSQAADVIIPRRRLNKAMREVDDYLASKGKKADTRPKTGHKNQKSGNETVTPAEKKATARLIRPFVDQNDRSDTPLGELKAKLMMFQFRYPWIRDFDFVPKGGNRFSIWLIGSKYKLDGNYTVKERVDIEDLEGLSDKEVTRILNAEVARIKMELSEVTKKSRKVEKRTTSPKANYAWNVTLDAKGTKNLSTVMRENKEILDLAASRGMKGVKMSYIYRVEGHHALPKAWGGPDIPYKHPTDLFPMRGNIHRGSQVGAHPVLNKHWQKSPLFGGVNPNDKIAIQKLFDDAYYSGVPFRYQAHLTELRAVLGNAYKELLGDSLMYDRIMDFVDAGFSQFKH